MSKITNLDLRNPFLNLFFFILGPQIYKFNMATSNGYANSEQHENNNRLIGTFTSCSDSGLGHVVLPAARLRGRLSVGGSQA